MKKTVFISHSAKDKTIANAICEYLEAKEIPCWIAPRDIPYGDPWAGHIDIAIKNSTLLLFIHSVHSNLSKQCPKEVAIADQAGVPMLCVKIDDTVMSPELHYHFAVIQNLHLSFAFQAQALETVAQAVKQLLEETNVSDRKVQEEKIIRSSVAHKPQVDLEMLLPFVSGKLDDASIEEWKSVISLLKYGKPFDQTDDVAVLGIESEILSLVDLLIRYAAGDVCKNATAIVECISALKQKAALRNVIIKK